MSLVQRLSDEIKAAMFAKDAERLSALRMLKSAIGYTQIERKNENLSEDEVISIIQKEAKKRRDASEQFDKGGRSDLAEKEKRELSILETFLPKALSVDELEQLVRGVIAETGAISKKDMGTVMKGAQSKAAGRADGRAISAIVARLLP